MTLAASRLDQTGDLAASAREAAMAAQALLADATIAVRNRVMRDEKISGAAMDREQRATHGLAWLATYVEAVSQLAAYTERMQAAGRFGEPEDLLVRIGLGEYLPRRKSPPGCPPWSRTWWQPAIRRPIAPV